MEVVFVLGGNTAQFIRLVDCSGIDIPCLFLQSWKMVVRWLSSKEV